MTKMGTSSAPQMNPRKKRRAIPPYPTCTAPPRTTAANKSKNAPARANLVQSILEFSTGHHPPSSVTPQLSKKKQSRATTRDALHKTERKSGTAAGQCGVNPCFSMRSGKGILLFPLSVLFHGTAAVIIGLVQGVTAEGSRRGWMDGWMDVTGRVVLFCSVVLC